MAIKEKPQWLSSTEAGAFIQRRREEIGLTQEQMVERTGIKNVTYLSSLENGRHHIGRSEYFGIVAEVLRLTEDEMLMLKPNLIRAPGGVNALKGYKHQGELADQLLLDDLPPGLEEAIRKYGEDYPPLRDPKIQQQLALARFYTGRGPQSASQWLAYYLSIASWIGT
ncbi:helix-turn-helix domain-containing protein [Deinococcus peraridilitoris]|nr:helix-turn-helix transcriptional regulator [Deinococcus peraridilitoris]